MRLRPPAFLHQVPSGGPRAVARWHQRLEPPSCCCLSRAVAGYFVELLRMADTAASASLRDFRLNCVCRMN